MKGSIIVLVMFYLTAKVLKCEGGGHDKIDGIAARNAKLNHSRYLNDVIHDLCMPRGTNRLVYRLQNNSKILVGFDDVKQGMVYSMSWIINENNREALKGNNQNGYEILPAIDVRKQLKLDNLLAATDEKIQKRFKKKIAPCSNTKVTSKNCIIQVIAFLARKMKEVNLERTCKN